MYRTVLCTCTVHVPKVCQDSLLCSHRQFFLLLHGRTGRREDCMLPSHCPSVTERCQGGVLCFSSPRSPCARLFLVMLQAKIVVAGACTRFISARIGFHLGFYRRRATARFVLIAMLTTVEGHYKVWKLSASQSWHVNSASSVAGG